MAGRFTVQVGSVRPALLDGFVLAIAALASYLLAAHGLSAIHSLSEEDDQIGGLWSVVATLFVCRFVYQDSVHAAYSRIIATLLSFVLCLVYLLIFPFSPLGLAVIIGLGTVILKLFGHEQEIVTAGITTAVIMVIAAPSPSPWEEPILRLADTILGVGVGLAAVWLVRGPIKSARESVPESGA
ncbi:MAG TPA: FUSC family protein [Nocardioidaceae bacterium]|nr:FUSC family protein [Nocardioidaceae bacterium]